MRTESIKYMMPNGMIVDAWKHTDENGNYIIVTKIYGNSTFLEMHWVDRPGFGVGSVSVGDGSTCCGKATTKYTTPSEDGGRDRHWTCATCGKGGDLAR